MQWIEKLIPRKKVHFIGIGGVGMSALAQILLARGFWVSGSDIKKSAVTQRLENAGAQIFCGHREGNVPDVDAVIYSSCIPDTNPEMIISRRRSLLCIRRGQLLAHLMQGCRGIAIAGAHGKTTTTSLISLLLQKSGLDPSFAIGADVDILSGNARHGQGAYFVAEADESDGSFLLLKPHYAVITNIDREHLDYYKNLKHIVQTYSRFIRRVSRRGRVFCYGEDPNIRSALEGYSGEFVTYGFSPRCDIRAGNIVCEEMNSSFDCIIGGEVYGRFDLNIPGRHNVLNSLACIGIGRELGLDRTTIQSALAAFRGAQRRFQIKNPDGRVMVVDDYAHHPTEIMATLQAARTWKNRRIVGVFQPHRYSRTKFLKKEFGRCFADADHLIITDIYAASETPIDGVGARAIYEEVKHNGHKSVCFLPKEKIKEHLLSILRDGDVLMMLGAGDITKLADELAEVLSAPRVGTMCDECIC